MKRILLAAALTLAAAAPLSAQQTPEAEVKAAVQRLFDGMRAADSAAVRAAFAPGATLGSVMVREGRTAMRADSIAAFVNAVGTPHTELWDERVSDVVVKVDGPLAMAWMNYTFFAGDRLSHCGVNHMQLVRGEQGWKITAITDTRRREGCPQLTPANRSVQ
jgi:hypothetical protein